jgi:4-hydroxybenzoate polyprenyltransferase
MSAPAFGALLWLGGFPPLFTTLVGIITVFAGYTSVYALNDVVDYHTDKIKMGAGDQRSCQADLDAAMVRHPMAQGLLTFREGLQWALGWGLVAVIGAFILNPVCVLIFLIGCILETIYCLLLQVSHWRALVSGVVKTLGTIAAIFAVDPQPAPSFLIVLFCWLFCWELGGQNLPNDWSDIEEDRHLGARTLPVRYGARPAALLIVVTLVMAIVLQFGLQWLTPQHPGSLLVVGALVSGGVLLIQPALKLLDSGQQQDAFGLFNHASYYPLSLFVLMLVSLLLP